MSIVYCDHCRENVDTDYNAEHFIASTELCAVEYEKDICPECEEYKPEDRVWAGMKCSQCAYC